MIWERIFGVENEAESWASSLELGYRIFQCLVQKVNSMADISQLQPKQVAEAYQRISTYVNKTPLVQSLLLNQWSGHNIWFKLENTQKIGAFKARGAINALLTLKEQGALPANVVTFSSGNHAQAVAWACRLLGIAATILIPKSASALKRQAAKSYGATVVEVDSRQEAEKGIEAYMKHGHYLLPPYDHDDVILGQGTACLEALSENLQPDAVFAPCGGGGLMSGTFLAVRHLAPNAMVYGAEPLLANDAAQSLQAGKIIRLEDTPDTIADGVRTLSVSPRTFHYLKQLSGIYEIEELEIKYWFQWLNHLLKTYCEPTGVLGMAAAWHWLKAQTEPKTVLVIISGGNMDPDTQSLLWQGSLLETLPRLS